MRRGLALEDLGDLLEQPAAATLGTYRADGTILVSPVWFRWSGGGFDVTVAADDVKVSHLRRDPRAVLVVFEPRPPFRGLELRAEARLLSEGVKEVRRHIASRFVGEGRGAAYANERGEEGFVIRLEPGRLRIWAMQPESGRASARPRVWWQRGVTDPTRGVPGR